MLLKYKHQKFLINYTYIKEKKIRKPSVKFKEKLVSENTSVNLNSNSIKQATKDSVRAIMLIRAYRIRGHLIASLDPLSIQKKDEHPE